MCVFEAGGAGKVARKVSIDALDPNNKVRNCSSVCVRAERGTFACPAVAKKHKTMACAGITVEEVHFFFTFPGTDTHQMSLGAECTA